jgi:hypothetical protein
VSSRERAIAPRPGPGPSHRARGGGGTLTPLLLRVRARAREELGFAPELRAHIEVDHARTRRRPSSRQDRGAKVSCCMIGR